MNGYTIELHATFSVIADSYDEAVTLIPEAYDLNDIEWTDELIEEMEIDHPGI